MKIVLLDGYASNPGDLSWEPLKEFGEVTIYDRTHASQVLERAAGATILITNKVTIDRTLMKQLPELKLICVLATGYNIIDTVAAKELGIVVCNVPAYSTESVAQMVFSLMLHFTNRVSHYAHQVREGRWSQSPDFCYWDIPVHELSGKTLGIIGLGNIGTKVAEIAHLFGMDVFA